MNHLHLVSPNDRTDGRTGIRQPAIKDLASLSGTSVDGQYVLTAAMEATINTPRLQLTLADASGSVLGFVSTSPRFQ